MAEKQLFSIKGLLELIPGIDAQEELDKLKMELEEKRTDMLSLTSSEENQLMADVLGKKGLQEEEENGDEDQDEI